MSKIIRIATKAEYETIVNFLRDGTNISFANRNQKRRFKEKIAKMEIIDGRIFIKRPGLDSLEYLADFDLNLKYQKINTIHLRSHRGLHALYNEIKQKFYNVKQNDIKIVLSSCTICSNRTVEITQTNITPIVTLQKNHRYQMDITYMFDYADYNNGKKYILLIMDCYSKFTWGFSLSSKSADEVYINLEQLFLQCNIPKEISSDNGLEFRNNKIASLCSSFNIRQVFGIPYHPQSQGQVERLNATIKTMILSVMNNNKTQKWVDILPNIIYEYNIKYNRSINCSPVSLFLNYSGFNVESNLANYNSSINFFMLTEDEKSQIETARYNYYSSIADTSRRTISRNNIAFNNLENFENNTN